MSREKKEKKLYDYPVTNDVQIELLKQSIGHINETLIRFEKRFDKIDDEFKETRKDQRTQHYWTLGLIFGIYALMAASYLPFFNNSKSSNTSPESTEVLK